MLESLIIYALENWPVYPTISFENRAKYDVSRVKGAANLTGMC